MNQRDAARSVGIWLLLGADALFTLAFVYITSYDIRRQEEIWPDVPDMSVIASPTLPVLVVLATLCAAVCSRFARPRAAVAWIVAGLALLLVFVRTTARTGLTWNVGAYGALVYIGALLLGVHLAGALVAAVLAQMQRRPAPYLGRFLAVWTVLSASVVAAVYLV